MSNETEEGTSTTERESWEVPFLWDPFLRNVPVAAQAWDPFLHGLTKGDGGSYYDGVVSPQPWEQK